MKLDIQDKETDSQVNEVEKVSGEGETKKLEIKCNTSTKKKQKKKKKKIADISSEENNKKKTNLKKLKFNSKNKLFDNVSQSDKLKLSLSDDRLKAYGFNPKHFKNKILYSK